ncbi:MAG: HEAT repeat domain-containing protein [Gammaproteobacteria bacterium]|nr:HEAT repeat domain-containing protein [Gammaproteobacteria bacterium]
MIGKNTLVTAFAEQVDKRYQPGQPASFWDCEPLFRHLLDPQFAESVINDALRDMVDDPRRTGNGGNQAMSLARTPHWNLALHLLTRPRRYLHSNASHALAAPMGGQMLETERYQLPAGFRNEVFDPSCKLERAGSRTVPPGHVLALHADGVIHDYRIATPMLLLIFETAPIAVLEWRFSRDTLHAWQFVEADREVSDLKAAAWLAGRLAHQTSLKPLKALTGHGDPGVRWAALQSIGRLSRSEVRKLLAQALDDPHPLVRRAARQALERGDDPPLREA